MAEYIKREAAVKAANEWVSEACMAPVMRVSRLFDKLQKVPAADVAPVVHGRWIPSESDFDDDDTLFDVEEWSDWQCSACRKDICYEDPMPMKLLPNHCPNCGAKMDGGDSDAAD